MINSIKFKENYEFYLEMESQKRFPHKKIIPGKYDREKNPYILFEIFSKDFMIEFKSGVNIIVGENGCGKSTLIRLIRGYVGTSFKDLISFDDKMKNENYYLRHYQDNYNGPLIIDGIAKYINTIFFDGENDNPVIALPKMINPMKDDFVKLTTEYIFSNEESHGESMLPLINYILDNAKGGYTIFMDEPETALSLGNQLKLAQKLKKSANEFGNQLIVSTHSLAIINEFQDIYDMEDRKWVDSRIYVKNVCNGISSNTQRTDT